MPSVRISVENKNYTDEEKFLSLNSDQMTLKSVLNSSTTVVVPGSLYTEVIIPHNLGYPPAYQVFVDVKLLGKYKTPMGGRSLFFDDGTVDCQMEENNLHVFITNHTVSDFNAKVRYIIFARNIA